MSNTSSALVNVLLSSYNGEQYIEEQIESILAQTYRPIKIYCRDDGSTDGTLKILRRYQSEEKLVLIEGENVGYGKSFLYLLRDVTEGAYWAFSDQDDHWFPQKIERAIQWMNTQNLATPLLFGGAYALTSNDLLPYCSVLPPDDGALEFYRAITECFFQGFSAVWNAPVRELALKANIENLSSHDWWIQLVAVQFGQTYLDDEVMCYHRRHEKSISEGSLKKRIRWFVQSMKGVSDIRSCAQEFYRVFYDQMNEEDRKTISMFAKKGMKNNLKKFFYPKRWRPGWSSEIALRTLMLLGRI